MIHNHLICNTILTPRGSGPKKRYIRIGKLHKRRYDVTTVSASLSTSDSKEIRAPTRFTFPSTLKSKYMNLELTPSACKDNKDNFAYDGNQCSCNWLSKRKEQAYINEVCKQKAVEFCKKTSKTCSTTSSTKGQSTQISTIQTLLTKEPSPVPSSNLPTLLHPRLKVLLPLPKILLPLLPLPKLLEVLGQNH